MRIWRRYGAIGGAILLLAALAAFAVWRSSAVVREDYYASWVTDQAGLLSRETKTYLRDANRRMDRRYGSLIGLLIVPELPEREIADFSYDTFAAYGFGGNDLLIVLSAGDRQGYLAYGDNLALYADNSLRQTALSCMTDSIYGDEANAAVRTLYDELEAWVGEHIPPADGQTYGRSHTTSGGAFFRVMLIAALLALAMLLLTRYLILPRIRRKSSVNGKG